MFSRGNQVQQASTREAARLSGGSRRRLCRYRAAPYLPTKKAAAATWGAAAWVKNAGGDKYSVMDLNSWDTPAAYAYMAEHEQHTFSISMSSVWDQLVGWGRNLSTYRPALLPGRSPAALPPPPSPVACPDLARLPSSWPSRGISRRRTLGGRQQQLWASAAPLFTTPRSNRWRDGGAQPQSISWALRLNRNSTRMSARQTYLSFATAALRRKNAVRNLLSCRSLCCNVSAALRANRAVLRRTRGTAWVEERRSQENTCPSSGPSRFARRTAVASTLARELRSAERLSPANRATM